VAHKIYLIPKHICHKFWGYDSIPVEDLSYIKEELQACLTSLKDKLTVSLWLSLRVFDCLGELAINDKADIWLREIDIKIFLQLASDVHEEDEDLVEVGDMVIEIHWQFLYVSP
jgi:hypothetical protein